MALRDYYYKGAVRFMRDGCPCRVASWVKDLSDRSRTEMFRSYDKLGTSQKQRELWPQCRHSQTTYLPLED